MQRRETIELRRHLQWFDVHSRLRLFILTGMWGDLCGVGHWNVKYFVLTPDILWMNQPCDHLLGRIYPILGDPATSAARVETGLPCPAQSWVTFVFSRRPWKVWQRWAGSGWVTSRPHGATKIGGKGMMISSQTYHYTKEYSDILCFYAVTNPQTINWAYNLFFRNSKQSINNQYKT